MDPGEPSDLLPLVLEICEGFFANTSPAVRREVDALLLTRDVTGGPGWLIDMLALTRRRLRTTAEHGKPDVRPPQGGGSQTHKH